MKKTQKALSGFTLLELMIVIAIVGIMAGIGIPNLLSYIPKARLNGAARTVLVDLMATRMKAVKTSVNTRISFTSNHEYLMCDDADVCDSADDGVLKDIQDQYSDVTFTFPHIPTFLPRGTGSSATITVSNPSGSKTITVSITGRVKIN
jgi:type II secretion system protein H